jgi:hypothetical protein
MTRPRARRWRSATTASTGCLCCPCTTHAPALLARLWRDASSSPGGRVADPLKSSMKCSVGGCGFRATYLKTVGLGPLATRSCRRAGKHVCITTQQAREATPEHFCQQSVTRTLQEQLTVYETRLTTHNLPRTLCLSTENDEEHVMKSKKQTSLTRSTRSTHSPTSSGSASSTTSTRSVSDASRAAAAALEAALASALGLASTALRSRAARRASSST